MLVILRPVRRGSYAMPVKPDCQATVYLFPGSYAGLFTSGLAYFAKFPSCEWSSGTSQPFFTSWVSCQLFVRTTMS